MYSNYSTAEKKVSLINGTYVFKTIDHRRSSSRYWRNIGFNICLQKTDGNPLQDKNRITIYFSETGASHEVEAINQEYNQTTYTVTRDLLRKKFNDKFSHIDEFYFEHFIETGARLYFNNIFCVYDGENIIMRNNIMTLSEIKNITFPGNIKWSQKTKDDFHQHFDREILYKNDPILPAQVVYYIEGTETPISKPTTLTPKSKEKWGKLGEDTFHTLASYKMCNGVKCKLVQSYYTSLLKPNMVKENIKTLNSEGTNLKDVKNQTDAEILDGGTLFVGILRPAKVTDTVTSLEGEFLEPCPTGVIKADIRGQEKFDVEDGIPTSEEEYVNAFSPEYLSGYRYSFVNGERMYFVTVNKPWTLTWTTKEPNGKDSRGNIVYKNVDHSKKETVTQTILVKREFSYYLLDYFDVYGLASAQFENYSLPNEKVKVDAVGYMKPIVAFTADPSEASHIIEPTINVVNLPGETKDGGDQCPSPDDEDFTSEAEDSVEKIRVRNDKLEFNNKTLMSSTWKEENTDKPEGIPYSMSNCDENVLYKKQLLIDPEKSNGIFQSDGTVTYQRIQSLNSELDDTLTYDMEVNDVTIHTPTICDAKITDLKAYNQMVQPSMEMASLILDKNFTVRVLTSGKHNDYRGYGYRDYEKYVTSKKVRFPFDVYRGNTYIRASTWITLNGEEETFYLPIWVNEGRYVIDFETPAINCDANNGYYNQEYYANLWFANYVATDSINVQVTGRLYDLQIYDISDYPLWKSIFRKQNSLALTGFTYKVGINDQNGYRTNRSVRDTFPLIYGSHPIDTKEGVVKLGYCTRFRLTTIGDMYNNADYIHIKPRFYYVDQQGGNRQEVDLYYTETFMNRRQYLAKVGSSRDKQNSKQYLLGNTYWQVPNKEIEANALVDNVLPRLIKARREEMFTFGDIRLNTAFRTYIGDASYIPSKIIPMEVGIRNVTRSVQRWYGEYYLPSEVHVLPKGFDLKQYMNKYGYVDYKEKMWLKHGYIIVNFDIVTYQTNNTEGNLSYINQNNAIQGFCNMWQLEGAQLNKVDCYGNRFDFKYGDYIMYDTEKSVVIDYRSGGTH